VAGGQPQPIVRFYRPETMDTDPKCGNYDAGFSEIDLEKLQLEHTD
jgi:hypothetical protein